VTASSLGGSAQPSGSPVVQLEWRRFEWIAAGIVLFFIAAIALLQGAALLLSGGTLNAVGGVALFVLGLGCLAGVRLAARAARIEPRLVIEKDVVLVEHPGLLTGALRVPRGDIREVWIRKAPDRGGQPDGTAGRQRFRVSLPRGGEGEPPPVILCSRKLLPDLSRPLGVSRGKPDVVIAFQGPVELGRLPRRGLGLFALLGDEWSTYLGPVRGSRPYGLAARVKNLEDARQAFDGLGVTVERPSPETLSAITPRRRRRNSKAS
jgi:hypothetical protein